MRQGLGRLRPWHAATAVCMVVLFCGLGGYPLTDPDESRSAEIAREMIEGGNWLTPTLNYVAYFEKPPLMHWLIAASMGVLGPGELGVRVVPTAAAVFGMLVAWWLARATVGEGAARWAPGVFATTLVSFALARYPVIDMLYSTLLAASLTAWWCGNRPVDPRAKARGWTAASGAFLGLAVLAKGPSAFVLYCAIAVVYLTVTRARFARFLMLAVPAAIAIAVAGPWFIVSQARHPEFFHQFLFVSHFQRFTGGAFTQHRHPVWYYVPVLLLGWLPWSALWPVGLPRCRERWRGMDPRARSAAIFTSVWAVVVVGMFSASSSKLAAYVFPAWWPISIGTASLMDRLLSGPEADRCAKRSFAALGIAVLLAAVGVWLLGDKQRVMPVEAARGPVLAAAIVFAFVGAAFIVVPRLGFTFRTAALVASSAALLAGLVPAYRAFAWHRELGDLLPESLRGQPRAGNWAFACYHCRSYALAFYTGTRVVMIDSDTTGRPAEFEPDDPEWFRTGPGAIDDLSARGPLALVVPAREADAVGEAHCLTTLGSTRELALLMNAAGLREAKGRS